MTHQQLDWSRKLVPGIIVIACWAIAGVVLTGWRDLDLLSGGAAVVLAVFFGWIYTSSNVRYRVTDPAFTRYNSHIVNRLYEMCGRPLQSDAMTVFRKLKPRYYNLIDNDNSLKRLSERIQGNGAIWTTWADISLIAAFHGVMFGVAWIGTYLFGIDLDQTGRLLILWIGFLAVAALARGLLYPMTVDNHISLIDDQIDHMSRFYRDEICEEIRRLESN